MFKLWETSNAAYYMIGGECPAASIPGYLDGQIAKREEMVRMRYKVGRIASLVCLQGAADNAVVAVAPGLPSGFDFGPGHSSSEESSSAAVYVI